ncbi:MAG: slipin family protein [Leptonema illini]|jgi:regulator of protease activity HflC (stomatin/prohibitin superfamily)|uniref:SPFH domain, Band 7 family protein n=2 Tax=Leptonema illini TaxID=183 RepID=H2CBA9_9LEPT|nr:slipin family protein [Leptonema illini]EHQ06280.1 SPFH domain, Band 7 family protein [Leptonema illini DSM 21528]KAB2929778.1 MAG: slipin family protein [Leptonema illini]
MGLYPIILIVAATVLFFSQAIRVLKEYERGVVFRLGRFSNVKGPGLIILIPFIDKMEKVSLRTVAMDVPPQDIITKDNVTTKVNAVVYFRVMDAQRAVIEVEDVLYATSQLAQTTLRSILGESELDEILSEREKINEHLQTVLDRQTDAWGIKVSLVELKHIDLPQEMQRAMARQAEAERERRAKIISAEGEFQASQKLSDAAAVIEQHPVAIQLRYMQTLVEISADKNSTIVFPLPVEMLSGIIDSLGKKK